MVGTQADQRDHLRMTSSALRRGASRSEVIELLSNGFGLSRRQAEHVVFEVLDDLANLALASGRR